MDWTPAVSVEELQQRGRLIKRMGGKQLVLFRDSNERIFACNNRCPHQGYPLVEGTLDGNCTLTCNWHNWKFDLGSGETLVGGDTLRVYPTRVRDGVVEVDLSDPLPEERVAAARQNLRHAMDKHEYDRMARELARIVAAGGSLETAVCDAVQKSHDRLEFGTTHAYAAAADWLALGERRSEDEGTALACALEAIAHMAWDSLRQPLYPYALQRLDYSEEGLLAALEGEDEAGAVARVRGALDAGLGFEAMESALTRAALVHYQDFGHSLIYVLKTGQLIERLGPTVAEPLLLALVRSLVYATREDLIPDFRSYRDCLLAWDGKGDAEPAAEDFIGKSVNRALDAACGASAHPQALYPALLEAGAWHLLHFDLHNQRHVNKPVSHDVGWLGFTHAITFANAVRIQCAKFPHLWPHGLLQMACFVGRNSRFLDPEVNPQFWEVESREGFMERSFDLIVDHGQGEYIFACHYLKLLTAVRSELLFSPSAPWEGTLLAATNRFLNSPIKRKHIMRTANQALSFVAKEG